MAAKTILDLTLINQLSDAVNFAAHDTTQSYRATLKQLRMLLVPVGSYLEYAGEYAPEGYLVCDGSAVNRTVYSDLFAVIGTKYGVGNGNTTFNLPNWNEEFSRATTDGSKVGTKRAYSTALPTTGFTGVTDSKGGHSHTRGTMDITGNFQYIPYEHSSNAILRGGTGAFSRANANVASVGHQIETDPSSKKGGTIYFKASDNWTGSTSSQADHAHATTVTGGGDVETAPKHMLVLRCIKY